jgi:hypothetical protein
MCHPPMYIKPQALFSLIIYFSVLKRRKTLNIQIVFFFAATRPGGGRTHDPDTTGTSPVIKLKCSGASRQEHFSY